MESCSTARYNSEEGEGGGHWTVALERHPQKYIISLLYFKFGKSNTGFLARPIKKKLFC